ncbi:MAG: UvrD-helicase domain-containing protein [Ardenticatenaceae bacterium]|nr:UvrD-helicase domain-containing protein [Ardenticatenaceae bacterium]
MDLLNGLNQPQIAAVTAADGPVLVLAGPGSGKTRVLTNRIVYLIRERHIAPWHILAVTFTNKAAREMNHRIEALLDGQPRGLSMGTFHSTCVRLLRRESDNLLYYNRDFVIFDTSDQQQVVKQALADLNLDEKKFQPNKMLNGISSAKNELITPDIYTATNYISEVTKRVYTRYQEILKTNNAMDFDDLLLNVVDLFEERPDVLSKYQTQYEHVLVDEFQDTNTAQYKLLKRLTAVHQNLFVVGDSDQSVYRWRGADFRNIQRFRDEYPQAQMILLEQNYRSTQNILDAAKAVIKLNPNRVHKELFTERKGGERILLREAYNENDEAEQVVSTIEGLLLNGRSLNDFAVMYRTNAQSRVLEEAFLRAGMPYKLVGATQFYRRREVKDIIAYMRIIHNLADSVSFGRVINTPTRGIGKKTEQQFYDWARLNGWSPGEAMLKLVTDMDVQHPFNGRSFNALATFGQMFHAWYQLRDEARVSDLMDTIIEQSDYRSFVDDGTEEGRDRWANIMELRNVAAEADDLTLSEFIEQVALVSDQDDVDESQSRVTLLTLHAAKGLEFPVVFLTGLEDGVLPHSRSLDDGEEMAEERRLFYVGITRAKDRLYLSHAFRRTFFGDSSVSVPSRFLKDIPIDLLDGDVKASNRYQQATNRATNWQWSSTPQKSTPSSPRHTAMPRSTPATPAWTSSREKPLPKPRTETVSRDFDDDEPKAGGKPQFKTGEKVSHAKFGEGTVIESKWVGNDEEVTIAFPGVGIKRLVASFAKLEKI